MTTITSGDLISVKKGSSHYYYLVLSEPLYYGCRWSYAFHTTSQSLLTQNELLLRNTTEGFQALIDFQTHRNQKHIFKIGEGVDIEPYRVKMNSKVRIDKLGGGHEWYIFNSQLQILKKQKKLKSSQAKFPIASGLTCDDAHLLIEKKWRTDQFVKEEGRGQFPIGDLD